MKDIKVVVYSVFLIYSICSCTYTPPEPPEDPTNPRTPPVAGNADFSKYIAVGNSLTAGFMDNALYLEGQQNAYPVILADRMKSVNGNAAFNIPEFGVAGGAGFGGSFVPGTSTPVGRLRFILPDCAPNPQFTKTLGLTPAPLVPGEGLLPYTGNKAELNNFGVPGAKIFHPLIKGYGASPTQGNPFFWRFASAPTASLIEDAVAAKGTFFTYWLGNNDVLSYATSGGSGNPDPGTNPLTYTSNDLTDPRVFAGALKLSLDALLGVNANTKGAIATIPDVIKIPYFRLINASLSSAGAIPFSLSAAQAAALNAGYARLGPAAAGVNFKEGKINYPVIATSTGLRNMDPAQDLLTLVIPQDSLLVGPVSACNPAPRGGWGIIKPIPARFVLDQAEATLVTNRVKTFNDIIRLEVASRNNRLALIDTNALLANLEAAQNTLAPPTGFFSLDGVHPNPRGQAVIANAFIKGINAAFGSTLPLVNSNNYRLNTLPTQ